MAQKQTKRSTAGNGRKKKTEKKPQTKPIRREIGAVVCLLMAVFTMLACFRIHAAFLDVLTTLFKGLIGAGFYVLPFAFLMGFLILLLHDGRPGALRVTCTFLVTVLLGSLVQEHPPRKAVHQLTSPVGRSLPVRSFMPIALRRRAPSVQACPRRRTA